ncbi:ABC transporter ATP-binding protein [Paenibacillus rigui]|uniref:ABC transporter ATP-binding protein n=1 Tax=Paenibacillus rigui TaxID=554312 RepID=A0A229UQ39_9BACL|nr:dipeptide/oligopeptide/nickel ABC transporter ATP-binding protein [Paenibacillus rigui]OXM84999.1 ABC transporter ATP-binding protein [Paenibacillus rigui]
MLEVSGLSKKFDRNKEQRYAVQDVSLTIADNEIFALVGESGSGKSTLAEMIVGLQRPSAGRIYWQGQRIERKPDYWQQVQMIFQNPDRSLNPYWKVRDLIAEPLILQRVPREDAYHRVARLLEQVSLPRELGLRSTSECSGGQKQRVAIARALALPPQLLIADEMTSALDPLTEREMLRLLLELKREHRLSLLYITHRLETIDGFADRLAVMKDGRIVETGSCADILNAPQALYTKRLLDACDYSAEPGVMK